MPHLAVHALESDLTGRETALIARLTDAVAAVYGPWARDVAVVQLFGLPPGRWGIGGKPASHPAPHVTFGIKEEAFARTASIDALAAGVTDAIATVIGDRVRPGVTIDFIGTPDGRTAVGGIIERPSPPRH